MADEDSKVFSKASQKYSLDGGLNDGKCHKNKSKRASEEEILRAPLFQQLEHT